MNSKGIPFWSSLNMALSGVIVFVADFCFKLISNGMRLTMAVKQ